MSEPRTGYDIAKECESLANAEAWRDTVHEYIMISAEMEKLIEALEFNDRLILLLMEYAED